jgi:hypothetical protein
MIAATTPSGKKYKIDPGKEVARGGEGAIITIDANIAAKIYHPGIAPPPKAFFSEISVLDQSEFVKPIDMLMDASGNVIGFTMRMIGDEYFPVYQVMSKAFCNQHGLDEKYRLALVNKIADAVKDAHAENVVIGDLNPYNILVNTNADRLMIDVDSYETRSRKHSNRLLEDVRDFYKGGTVCKESDYFAMAVMAFNLLTFMHPFKGVHSTYKGLAPRMINKISVMDAVPGLIVPKCYEPLQDKQLESEFRKIFNDGMRYMIDFSTSSMTKKAKAVQVVIVSQKDITYVKLVSNETILSMHGDMDFVVILTDKRIIAYDTRGVGIPKLALSIPTTKKIQAFCAGGMLVTYDGSTLRYAMLNRGDTSLTEMLGITVYKGKAAQIGSMLMLLDDSTLYGIDMRCKPFNDIPTYYSSQTYGPRVKNISSMFQSISGKTLIMYSSGTGMPNSVIIPENLIDFHQDDDVGCMTYIDNSQTVYGLMRFEGMSIRKSGMKLDYMAKVTSKSKSIIAVPDDDKVHLLRYADMTSIMSLGADFVSRESNLHFTNAGLFVANGDDVYVMNKK